MKFEVKKRNLASAISQAKALHEALVIEGVENPTIKIRATQKSMRVYGVYCEVSVSDSTVKEPGTAVFDLDVLTKALSVSGDKLSLVYNEGDYSASYTCGRSKGKIPIGREDFLDEYLEGGPKSTIRVPAFKQLLTAASIKAGDGEDRTLHFYPKKDLVVSESTDGYRGIVTKARATSDKPFDAASVSLPQKAADVLAKLVEGQAVVGFDDSNFAVTTPGFRAVIPLSSEPPLEVGDQMASWLESQESYGKILANIKDLKSAITDIKNLVGDKEDPNLYIEGGSNRAFLSAKNSGGYVETECEFIESNVQEDIVFQLSSTKMIECLSLYKDEAVRIEVFDNTLSLDLVKVEDNIVSQTTVIPHITAVEKRSYGDSDDD